MPSQTTEFQPIFTPNYTRYVLGVLVVVFVFNFIDRQILAILAPAIKEDLDLSDTQIGALSGVAFGIFYATLGIPIARLADKHSRVNIISICLVIWSCMTALSGFATNFWHLLVMGLVLGPTTVGILSDLWQSDAQMSDVDALRYALVACNFVYFISFINYWMASRHLKDDLAKSQTI